MNNFNYNYVGMYDVSIIRNLLNEINEDVWLEHTLRQTQFEAHKETQTIELMWDINSLPSNEKGKIHNNFYKFNIGPMLDGLKFIFKNKYGEGEFIRVLLVKLKNNSYIYPHKDFGTSLNTCKRTHIPVITNPLVKFIVGGEEKYMKEGEIWEINNGVTHSVENKSDEDRIHFIIDYKNI